MKKFFQCHWICLLEYLPNRYKSNYFHLLQSVIMIYAVKTLVTAWSSKIRLRFKYRSYNTGLLHSQRLLHNSFQRTDGFGENRYKQAK